MSATWNEILIQLRATTSMNLVGASAATVLRELLISKSIESSFFLTKLIKFSDGNLNFELKASQVETIIAQNISSISQLTVFTLIYPLMKRQYNNATQWRNAFLSEKTEGMFQKFNEWAVSQSVNENIFKQLLKLLICALPHVLKSQYIQPTQIQFESFLLWLSYFEVKDRQQHQSVCRAVKLIKDARIANTPDYEHKGHLILRKIIQLLGYQQCQNGSLFMLFDPLSIRQKDIEYFCNVYQHLLEDLDQLYLCNIFKSLTHCGINRQILFLIQMISHILQNSEQFYTLRYLYHQYILPILAYKFKTHRKLQRQVFNLVLFYVAGFLAHCKLDESAISCLVQNMESLEPQRQLDWAQLALLACKDDIELKQNTRKKLAHLNLTNVSQLNMSKIIEKNNRIWKVTIRNGRKLKKYPQIDSVRYKGIINRCNDCYIISTVQALLITQLFPNFVSKVKVSLKKEKAPVINQLYKIFDALQRKQQKITVASLKNKGPETFRDSNNQEDVQQYLLQLFNTIQQQLRPLSEALAYYQKLFKIECQGKFICQSCGQTWKKQRNEFTYIYSFRYNQVFQFKTQSKIQGYQCRKCKKENLLQETTIINQPKLLILHINRFSHNQGIARKNLGNKPIKRKIGNYELAGFISHRGAKISAGHYIFYGCLGKGRWGIFDDLRVAEFSVGEQEQFERQFRSENTPYILFYRLVKNNQ